MNCSELRDDYELHALGLSEDPEKSEIEAHLRRGCDVCRTGMQSARQFNAAFVQMLHEQKPARSLRERVVSAVSGESVGRLRVVAVSGLLLSATAALILVVNLRAREGELREARTQLARLTSENQRIQDALSILNAPETKAVTFSPGPRGRVFVNPSRGVLLIASNLQRTRPGRTYQLWVIPKQGAPRPAGVFNSDPSGNAVFLSPGAVDLPATGAVAVSVEPEAGSQQPTTTPILVVPVAE